MSQKPIAIAYLPWADLKEEFTVGPVSFWPFDEKAEEKITDSEARTELTQFFKVFVDHVGKPVETIVACSVGDIGFRQFTVEEWQAINAAVDCLVFAAIATGVKNGVCANNRSMAPPSADRFDIAARWAWPLPSGSIALGTENSRHIWTQGDYIITQPVSVGGSFMGNYIPLLEGLGRTFDSAFPVDVRERLWRSFEWFRFAHTESTAMSRLHKVVMMATAYEILLDFPDSGKRRYFIDQIDSKVRLPDSYTVPLPEGRGGTFTVCKAAEWAGQFYKLRNNITHGDQVPCSRLQYKDWVTHLIVADILMLEWVKRLLYEHGCLGDDLRQRAAKWTQDFGGTIEDNEQSMLSGILGLGFEDVHEALGWIPPLDERLKELEEHPENKVSETSD